MSQRTIDSTDSDAFAQPSVDGAGISLVPPGSGGHLPADTPAVHEVGPRFSEWLPDLHEAILPTVVRTVRKLAFEYDPRVLTKQRRFLFPQECLHRKHGVGGWEYSYQEAVAKYTLHYADADPDELRENERHAYDYVKASLTGVGTGRDGVNAGLDALDETVIPLLEAGSSPPPTVVLYLDGPAWSDIDDERTAKRALDALSTMGTVCDLQLVCSPRLESHIERAHPEWYDEHLTESGDATQVPAPNETSESALTMAWKIVGGFASGGGRLRLLAALSSDSTREVRDLKRDAEIDLSEGAIDRYVRELADEHGLIEIDDRHKFNRVSLTATGSAAQTLIGPDFGTVHPEQARFDSDLTRTPHASTSVVCRPKPNDSPTPPADGGGSGAVAAADAAASSAPHSLSDSSSSSVLSSSRPLPTTAPSAEEWLAETGNADIDGYVQWLDGPDGRLDAWEMHERLLAGRRAEGVTFVDDAISAFDDGEVSYISCFEDHAQVVAQWGGPLCTLVRVTSALLSEKMWSKVLTPSAVGDDLEELYDGALTDAVQDVLRLGAQVGWFSNDECDYDSLRERYGMVRRLILSKLGEVKRGDSPNEWGDLCRDAHGLLASATHLYRAIDVDVTIHIRVPDTAKLRAGEDRYQGFCDFFKHTVPKSASYGVHSVYRMLIEDRVDKLKHRLGYEFSDDATADLTASWVVSGPTATVFREDVERAIAAKADDVRESIKKGVERGVALQIPVVEGNSYAALRRVVERHARRKGFTHLGDRELRRIIRLSTATLGRKPGRCSPYALAEALLSLAKARKPTDSLDVTDVTHGFIRLPAERLMPSFPPTMRKALKTLLIADKPLGASEIIDRAGISESSYNRNIDELAALGMVEAVGSGGHRKWMAWIIPWWSPLTDADRPRTTDTDDTPSPPSRWDDILYQIVLDLGLPHDYDLFAGPVDLREVFDTLPALDRWRGFIETHYGLGDIEAIADCNANRGSTDGDELPVTDRHFVEIGEHYLTTDCAQTRVDTI